MSGRSIREVEKTRQQGLGYVVYGHWKTITLTLGVSCRASEDVTILISGICDRYWSG